jgi:hypothetical protein
VLGELQADLRAMHGCLITGSRLLAPARDDLHRLLTGTSDTSTNVQQHEASAGSALLDQDKPPADVADQQQPVLPDDGPGLDEIHTALAERLGQAAVLEADPADATEQIRIVPVATDDEHSPWGLIHKC